MKKFVTIVLATGTLAIAFLAGKTVGAAATSPTPGSPEDPLITKSYVQTLENRVASLEAKVKSISSKGTQSKAQTLKARNWNKILFQSYNNPTGAYMTNSRFTAPESGTYLINAYTGINGVSSGNKVITSIFRNGGEHARLYEDNKGSSGSVMAGGTTLIYLPKGQSLELYTYISSQTASIPGWNKTFMQVYKLN